MSQKSRNQRRKQRQQQRTQRQKQRTQRQKQRQMARTRAQKEGSRRIEARKASRQQRQQVRQQNRSRRSEARQAVRMERVKQKGASGFYSPEGIKARGQVAGDIVSQVGSIGAGIATGGLSTGLGALAGLAGESELQGFGGAVGFGGDPMPVDLPIDTSEETEGFDFSFSNPLVIGGAVATAGLLYFATRPKKGRKK